MKNFLAKIFIIVVFAYLCVFAISLGLYFSVSGTNIITVEEFRTKHKPILLNGTSVKQTWGHPVINNSLGFRDKEILSNEADDKFRILALGDSFTWGAGISEESRYLNLLENKLNETVRLKQLGNLKVRIYNLALQGANTNNYLGLLRKYIEIINPDLVFVGITYNDTNERGWLDDPILKFFSRKLERPLLAILKATDPFDLLGFDFYLTSDLLKGTLENAGILRDPYNAIYKSGYDKKSKNWKRFENDLEQIFDISMNKTGKKPVAFILTPSLSKKDKSEFSSDNDVFVVVKEMMDQLEAAAIKKGFFTVNSLENFVKLGNYKYLSINNLDGHPNVLANKIYALTLENYFNSKAVLLFN